MRRRTFLGCMGLGILGLTIPVSLDKNEVLDRSVKFGIDNVDTVVDVLNGRKVGLMTNKSGVNSGLESSIDVLNNHSDVNLRALYGPEHGLGGDVEACEAIANGEDSKRKLPVYSLFKEGANGFSRESVEDVDVIAVDIQDIGVRSYTYVTNLAQALEASIKYGKEVVVLDRPNPLNGNKVEGPILEERFVSEVGYHQTPYIYGMTFGELAGFFNGEFYNNLADVSVVELKNWKRKMNWVDTGKKWVGTSPNIPKVESVFVCPTTGPIGEGSYGSEDYGISEGVGIVENGERISFEFLGAPWIDGKKLEEKMKGYGLEGVRFKQEKHVPVFQKYVGRVCDGVRIKVNNMDNYRPFDTGIYLFCGLRDLFRDRIEFQDYVHQMAPSGFNLVMGNEYVLDRIREGVEPEEIIDSWSTDLKSFKGKRKNYLKYE
ncbi:MAG: hypothetical protein CMH63_02880 [Nanoarchaeota archaeon]|nr:hypothetical protein [Nanoarchaeota archaeon]|tara:strand:- start:24928 stop:26220 length:1293 start_codon:yes stop_codon:yes gene_type:complete